MSIRVACAGAGFFSSFHFGSWRRLTDVELVGACDRDLVRAKDTGAPAFSNLETMLKETAPDLLDVILPPESHDEAISAALEAGVRWIICQKPFCTELTKAEEVAKKVEKAGATLVVHENFRFQPWYRAIKRELENGKVGDVLNATFRLRPGDGQGRDAYLDRQPYFQKMPRFLIRETAVHWIDTFQFLFGPVSAVYADLRRINPHIAGEDAAFVLFDHQSGVRSLFDGNRHLDHMAENLRRTMGEALIEGTHGVLTLKGDGSVHHRAFGHLETVQILPPDARETFGGDCVHALQSHVIAAMRGDGLPENSAQDYLKVVAVEEAIYASATEGRKITLEGWV